MVGIQLNNAGSAHFAGGEAGPYGPPYYSSYGIARLSFEGDKYAIFLDYTTIVEDFIYTPIYDEFGNAIDVEITMGEVGRYFIENQLYNRDSIIFQTITPVEAIPEPLTILGAGTAMGMGAMFKRRLKK